MMEQPNEWPTKTEQEHEEEGGSIPIPGREQQSAEPPLADHQERYYTSPMAIPSFSSSHSSNSPSSGGSSPLPNLPFGSATVQNELGLPSPPPSSNFLSFGAGQTSTLNFFDGTWQHDRVEGMMQRQAPERQGRSRLKKHVIAERKRREKLQQHFMSLATIVPGIKKTDKLSLLVSTIDCVKQLEEKLKALEEQGSRRSSEFMVFDSKCCISAADNDAAGSGSRDTEHPGEHGSPEYLLQGEERGAGDGPLRG